VDLLVEQLYKAVKEEKPWVKFGVSPFGIWRPGSPPSVRGLDSYVEIYADSGSGCNAGGWTTSRRSSTGARRIRSSGTTSFFTGGRSRTRSGATCGWGTTRVRVMGEGANWPASELLEQVRLTRADSGASGNLHFTMGVFLQNRDSLGDRLIAGPYAVAALVPASPWLESRAPNAPRAKRAWTRSRVGRRC
jgi:hypothetical protein